MTSFVTAAWLRGARGLFRFALLAVCLSLFVSAQADDWPQFRGPNRDGAWNETGLLRSFPPDGPRVCWRVPVGLGLSSPVVVGNRVYLTDVRLNNPAAHMRILCFDEATGATIWTHEFAVAYPDWAFVPANCGGPAPTPVVQEGVVYSIGPDGHVNCLNAQDGALLWERELGKELEIKELSCRSSPLLDGNRLLLCIGAKPGAYVLALDKTSGQELWRALEETISNSSPVIIDSGGARQLIVWTCDSVSSLNPVTGKLYWREPVVTSGNDAIPTPVFQGARLLVGGLMLALDADHPAASVLWPKSGAPGKRILSNTSTALLRGDFVYSAKSNGVLVCLEADTGNEVWQTEAVTARKGGASIHITPAGDEDWLYTDEGNLILARLTPQGYEEISRAHLLKPTMPFAGKFYAWPPPAYANRRIYVRNDEELVCASLAATP